MTHITADTILYNGNIVTQDETQPRATAIVIYDGKIVFVGDDSDALAFAGADTRRYDLNGQTTLPGLTDAHLHWQWTSDAMHQVNVFELPTKQAVLDAVGAFAQSVPEGVWIRGHGWAQDLWSDRAFPTASDLDTIAPNNPVYLTGKSMHVAWVNTAALVRMGVDASTPDPDGGEIQRDAAGNPTGILLEAPAMQLAINFMDALSIEKIADEMLVAQREAHRLGLTGIHDLDDPNALAALKLLQERSQLGLRVTKYINKGYLQAAIDSGIRFGFGDAWIRIGGLKMFADGALGPRTALMIDPYEGEPNNRGITVTDPDEMLALAKQATLAGLPTAIHAIGDMAMRRVLDIFEAVRQLEAEHGIPRTARRHRIEHVQIIHPDDAHRLGELDIIASMQPIHATSDAETADRYLGERAALSYNMRVQQEAGAVLAFGSDSPIEPFNPFAGIHAAVTRQRSDGRLGEGWRTDACISLEDALRAYTIGPAYASGTDNIQGRLKAGYYADLIVIDRDLFNIPPADLHAVIVRATMVNGEWQFGEV